MDYTLKINDFEGPLDLLLHLIKEAKMNIFDFSVEQIVKSYLDYINKMQEINLTVASSYLVMASELIELKSRELLPKHEDEEEEEDLKENLINRLAEYQKYKEITGDFKILESLRQEVYTKLPEDYNSYKDDVIIEQSNYTVDDLVDAFEKFLSRQKENVILETKVTRKEISIEDRRIQIRNILKTKKRASFFDFFEVMNREYLVVTFLAILEMVRKHEINITQENNFDDIICEVA